MKLARAIPGLARRGAALIAIVFALNAAAQSYTQKVVLHPGWNAVWVEVDPGADPSPGAVFGAAAIEAVWTYAETVTSAQFIQDPSELAWNVSSWRVYVPTNRIESIHNNLFTVGANRAYLVKLSGSADAALSIEGRPSFRSLDWRPNAYNLRGLPVDSSRAMTFVDFFRASPAHYNSATGKLQAVSRLNPDGHWSPVSPYDPIDDGAAYWIYTSGESNYNGPLNALLPSGDSLDYYQFADEAIVSLQNVTAAPLGVTVANLSGPDSALAYATPNPIGGTLWNTLPEALSLQVGAGATFPLRLAIRRSEFDGDSYGTVLAIRSGSGARLLVPVSASKSGGTAAAPGSISPGGRSKARAKLTPQQEASALAGLWVGKAVVDSVSEVNNPTNTAAPTPVKTAFSLNVILHIDSAGNARLLREVIQLFKPAVTNVDSSGFSSTITPPQEVLLTEQSLISKFQPLTPREGQPVGTRISSTSYDYDASGGNYLNLYGLPGGSRVVTATNVVPATLPTNPFLHRYHPDHDNLDSSFLGFKAEAYDITRRISFSFSPAAPAGSVESDYGYGSIGGVYREVISGLHRQDLTVQGAFLLRRASSVGVLNQ